MIGKNRGFFINDIFLGQSYLYNNRRFVGQVLDAGVRIWTCDSSLEPSWHKTDRSVGNFRFARAARPQRAKMCFFTT